MTQEREHDFKRVHREQWAQCVNCGIRFADWVLKTKCPAVIAEPVREYTEGSNIVKVLPPGDAIGSRESNNWIGYENWYLGSGI